MNSSNSYITLQWKNEGHCFHAIVWLTSPSKKDSISTRVWWADDRALLAFSTSRRSFWVARLSFLISLPVFFLYILMKCSMTRWSKSSPPKWVSPLVATTYRRKPMKPMKKSTQRVSQLSTQTQRVRELHQTDGEGVQNYSTKSGGRNQATRVA